MPIDESLLEIRKYTGAGYAPVIDYGMVYPERNPDVLTEVNYADLKSGKVMLNGKEVPTASLSSYPGARQIAGTLKEWIQKGEFTLTEAASPLPGVESGITFKNIEERLIEEI